MKNCLNRLNSLQSNASMLSMIKGGKESNSLEEFKGFQRRVGKSGVLPPTIHIAGTKGKGSTAAFCASVLGNYEKEGNGWKVGLYTSPHLRSVRERIQIDRKPLVETKFCEYFDELWERLEKSRVDAVGRGEMEMPAYFPFLTLLAFHAFRKENVDVVVLEVGIGGAFDPTNVVENPVVCGITRLGMDHVAILGNTLNDIAWHKSGIFKSNVPAVSVLQEDGAMQVIRKRAKELEAECLVIVDGGKVEKLENVKIGLHGNHQRENAVLAVELCRKFLEKVQGETFNTETLPDWVCKGLAETQWEGRCQIVKVNDFTFYLDGAHTIESIHCCIDWFDSLKVISKKALLFNCTQGRDYATLLAPLLRCKFDVVVFSSYVVDSVDSDVECFDVNAIDNQREMADWWKNESVSEETKTFAVKSIIEAYKILEAEGVECVLVTGSLHLVGNCLQLIDLLQNKID